MRRLFRLGIILSLGSGQTPSAWAQVRYQSGSQTATARGILAVPNLFYSQGTAAGAWAASLSKSSVLDRLGSYPSGVGGLAPAAETAVAAASPAEAAVAAAEPSLTALRVFPPGASPASARAELFPSASGALSAAGTKDAAPPQSAVLGGLQKLAAQNEDSASAGSYFDLMSAHRASDDGMPEPPEEGASKAWVRGLSHPAEAGEVHAPAAPQPPEPSVPSGSSRFWTALRLGITVALLAPVLYHAAPPPTLFYTAAAAFALAGAAWLVTSIASGLYHITVLYVQALRGLYRDITASSGRRLISADLLRSWVETPRDLARTFIARSRTRFWLGALGGSVAPLGLLVAYGVSPIPAVVYIGSAAFSIWAGLRLALRAGRMVRTLDRSPIGKYLPTAWVERLLEPARSLRERLRAKASLHAAALGLVLGFGVVLAVPLLEPSAPVVVVLYAGVMAVGGLWLFGFVADSARLATDLWRARGRLKRLLYAVGFMLGLGLGLLPTQYSGPVVEKGFSMGTLFARHVQVSKIAMGSLPQDWQAGIRMMAEGGEVRQIRGGAFEEETIRTLSKIPRGRALLDKFRDHGGAIHLPKFYLEDQVRTGAFENPIVHGVFISKDHVHGRGWDIEDFLADEAKQRQLAREIWEVSFHELKHTEQSFRFRFLGLLPEYFPGQFDHFPWQVTSVFHMELEYEAHIEEHLAFMEMLQADLDAPGDDEGLAELLIDLDLFLRGIDQAGAYQEFKHVDSEFFREYIRSVKNELPSNGVRGLDLLARRYHRMALREQSANSVWARYYLAKSREYLARAQALAREHHLDPPAGPKVLIAPGPNGK